MDDANMTIQNLQRVMWRLRTANPRVKDVTNSELRRAIMYECGTDQRTYYSNRKALLKLQWIVVGRNKQKVIFTDKELTDT